MRHFEIGHHIGKRRPFYVFFHILNTYTSNEKASLLKVPVKLVVYEFPTEARLKKDALCIKEICQSKR